MVYRGIVQILKSNIANARVKETQDRKRRDQGTVFGYVITITAIFCSGKTCVYTQKRQKDVILYICLSPYVIFFLEYTS